jgi:hypothetical protein
LPLSETMSYWNYEHYWNCWIIMLFRMQIPFIDFIWIEFIIDSDWIWSIFVFIT